MSNHLIKKPHKIADFLIIGGGVIGVAVARSLTKSFPNSQISILEKENHVAYHTSGRNSGVLHAGFYYSSDSLKAAFCRVGNEQWTQYCDEYKLPIRKCGKLVVPKNESEVQGMKELFQQGLKNKVELHMISRNDALKIDPYVRGYGSEFIWSPHTSVVDSKALVEHMVTQLEQTNKNFQVLNGQQFMKSNGPNQIITQKGDVIEYKYLINAAGQQSLDIAQAYGFGKDFDQFPMKGNFVISERKLDHLYKTLVYPVPIKGAYFLGVHSTLTIDGYMKIGPTISPAFSLENYGLMENIKPTTLYRILKNYASLLLSDQKKLIWTFITEEMPKHSIKRMVSDVSKIHEMNPQYFKSYYKPGIRAQLINKKTMKMHNDFILEYGKDQLHILNIVSPGFTCALPVADYIVKEIVDKKLIQ